MGLHTNVSTKRMREDGGYKCIEDSIKKLEKCHKQSIQFYDPRGGLDNVKRLTGQNETSHIDKFTWAVADRGASVRISKLVAQKKKGFLKTADQQLMLILTKLLRVLLVLL
ncbi:hypothetical protein NQ314_009678 [Rhamnusium bicolor]|uniref:glutamine synthetase n=1 Tax=Rhamnusium bicolor TaxID=1586634 RepID=A0AAV8XX20_9CUCU|nr:hypothetical protein NQ314_009678 [Rhamnusium bicolor]